jgi:hypothetical protein
VTTRRSLRFRPAALGLLIVSAAIVIIGAIVDVHELALAFLVAYAAVVSTVLGTLTLTLIAHLTTATWFRPFRPHAELVIASLPALSAIGLLLLLAVPTLYPWFGSASPLHTYLNVPFFVARWVLYWVVWIGTAELLRATRRMHERGDVSGANRRFRRIASGGLIAVAVTMTFAAFDWMMSLTPEWQSSIYGVYWFAGGILSAVALLAVMAHVAGRADPRAQPAVRDVHALGKLMTTFVLFWLYIGFSQYIVIWSADVPREVTWYVARSNVGWGAVALVLVAGNFVAPFLLLLFRSVKRRSAILAAIGGALLALHYLDTLWIVMPGVGPMRWWTVLVNGAAVVLVCAAAVFATRMRRDAVAHRSPATLGRFPC